MTRREPLLERLLAKARISAQTGCWEWTAHRSKAGYGRIKIDGAQKMAHRVSYEIYCGPIPEGMHVLHNCDNPACINSGHLFLGTQADNMADKQSKGRQSTIRLYGVDNGRAKLSSADVLAIRGSVGIAIYELAKRYGVRELQIWRIRTRKCWAHI